MNTTNATTHVVDRERHTNPSQGYAAIFATVLIWATPSLFMYYLNRYYDPWTQNFYRYLVACLAIAPLLVHRSRRNVAPLDWRAVMMCLIPCLPNVVHQVTQVVALFYMGPGVYTIFGRASVIFTALLALAFFPGTPGDSAMAVPSRNITGLNWSLRRNLVSTRPRNRTYETSRTIHCLYCDILLVALQRSD